MGHYPATKPIQKLIKLTEVLGLVIIAIATLIATGEEIFIMIEARTVTLGDLLILFIYLEILAMVGIYLDSGRLPIRMPLYVAIVALARYLILDMKNLSEWKMLAIATTIFLITISVLVLRYGHLKLPYSDFENREKNLRDNEK
ncbi:phosphate-starvation-inducible protein PsiE [Galenea microaerophila]